MVHRCPSGSTHSNGPGTFHPRSRRVATTAASGPRTRDHLPARWHWLAAVCHALWTAAAGTPGCDPSASQDSSSSNLRENSGLASSPTVRAIAVVAHPPWRRSRAAATNRCRSHLSVLGATPFPWCPQVPWGFAATHTMRRQGLCHRTSLARALNRAAILPRRARWIAVVLLGCNAPHCTPRSFPPTPARESGTPAPRASWTTAPANPGRLKRTVLFSDSCSPRSRPRSWINRATSTATSLHRPAEP